MQTKFVSPESVSLTDDHGFLTAPIWSDHKIIDRLPAPLPPKSVILVPEDMTKANAADPLIHGKLEDSVYAEKLKSQASPETVEYIDMVVKGCDKAMKATRGRGFLIHISIVDSMITQALEDAIAMNNDTLNKESNS